MRGSWLGGGEAFETLEARALLAGDFVISEFMASNTSGLKDQDNAYSDWIEIHNRGLATESLNGWFLTDTNNNLSKWRFPDVVVPADGYLVVFASNKNRVVAGQELHTNFKLSTDGDYLALVKPDGVSIAAAFSPQYPMQVDNVSYGILESYSTLKLLQLGSPGKMLVPSADIGNSWNALGYDDSGWNPVATGIGFDTAAPSGVVSAYTNLTGANGTQSFTGALGQDFTVNHPIIITSLGVFDSGADGLKRTITSQLWQRAGNSGIKLAELNFTGLDPGTLVNSNRFKGLDVPLVLQPGAYSIVSYGYGGSAATPSSYEPNGSEATGGPGPAFKQTNSGSGAISFTGTRFSAAPGGFPTSSNPSPFYFSAATFQFAPSIFYNQISSNVQAAMSGVNSSAYLRLPFDLAEIPPGQDLSLNVKYDDGFVAYLNGTEVARRNAPQSVTWNSAATAEHPDLQAVSIESIDIGSFSSLLNVGDNVLAIQALNASASNPDLLFNAELVRRDKVLAEEHYYAVPTPGAVNSTSYFNQIEQPKFSREHGFYDTSFDLTITDDTPGVTIRYTTDGTTPSANVGQIYSSPIHIGSTTTLRVGVFKTGFFSPAIVTNTYLFLDDVIRQPTNPNGFPTTWGNVASDYQMDPDVVNNPLYANTIKNDLKSVPTISLVSPQGNLFNPTTGIYANPVNEGAAWEKPTSVEWINSDGSEGFQIDAGMRMYGGISRYPAFTPKHSFRLAFRSEYGASKLNYPVFPDSDQTAFDYVILRATSSYSWAGLGAASNATYIQDQFARDSQLAMGDLAGHGRFVQLYVNGLYWGLYNLLERSGADMAAQYLGGNSDDYDVMKTFAVQDGNATAWNTTMALANGGLASDANYGLFKQLVDVENLADYIIVNVYGGNWDWPQNNWIAIRRSRVNGVAVDTYRFQFFCTDAEGTLYDINADRSTADADYSPGRLYIKAMENAEFRLMFADRLQKAFFNGGALSPTGAAATHGLRSTEIDRAIVGESARWADSNSVVPYTRDANWLPQINWLNSQYFPQRTNVVLNQFKALGLYPSISPPTFSQHGGAIVPGSSLTLSAAAGLTIYMTTDGSDPRLPGGAVSPTATVYSGAIPLQGVLDLKVRAKNAAGIWSALDEALFGPDTTKLRVTELMYSPEPPAPGGIYLPDDYQYVELQNTSSATISLDGVHFTRGLDFTFPNMTLAAGARVVVARNPDAFAERYPGVAALGPFADGGLSHSGETVRLETAYSTAIQEFEYQGNWYDLPQSLGYSLVIADPAANLSSWSVKAGWRPSQYYGGNPTTIDNGVNPGAIVINEVLANTTGAGGGRIELYNTTSAAIDISGWYLSNTNNVLNSYRLPANSIVPAGGYLVIEGASFSNPSPGSVPFTFSLLGDQAYLTSADAQGNLGSYREKASFGGADAEGSYGRYIKSTGGSDITPLVSNTFGGANSAPTVGPIVINELMYHPSGTNDEYIELYNPTSQAVPLYDVANPANTWRFTDGVSYNFPAGVTLAAQGFALVVGIDPNLFRGKYQISPSVPIFGPYSGSLNNGGETVELSKPGTPLPDQSVPYIPIDHITYQPNAPWPVKPDGDGYSLSRISPTSYGNDSVAWTTGRIGGTPGAANQVLDSSPPTAPNALIAGIVSSSRIDLSWSLASDQQTGIRLYSIIRNSKEIGVTQSLSYSDSTAVPGVTYSYEVAALNGDLTNGPKSAAISVSILGIASVAAIGNTHARVIFTEAVSAATATKTANYAIPGVTVLNAVLGPDGKSVMLTTSALADNIVYTVNVSGVATVAGEPIPAGISATFSTTSSNGLRGEYFTDTNFTNLSFERNDATVDFGWWLETPDARLGDAFSVRWTGEVLAKYTETYTFYTVTDDGVKLWVNGQQLINDTTTHTDLEFSGTISLVAGQRYTIRMDYVDAGWTATARLYWSSTSQVKQIIPASQLFLSPQIVVTNVAQSEGPAGQVAPFVFSIELTRPAGTAVTVAYNTQNSTAVSGSDYTGIALSTLTFQPGEVAKSVTVSVNGDNLNEPTEGFLLKLSNPVGAGLFNTQGTGTIINDDGKFVVGRSAVYNNSSFDGNTTAAGAADDAAIATDKTALLPGGKASAANYTNYSRGINGIMVDIAGLTATPVASDFSFKVGNSNSPSTWAAGPAPQSVLVRLGAGVNGAGRVEIVWADGVIKNTWIQVTVLPTARTGLAVTDVFYFGNAPGDTFDNSALAIVNSTDELQARNHPRTFLTPATITNLYDFNRDGYVNAIDQIIARTGTTTAANSLKLISLGSGLVGQSASTESLDAQTSIAPNMLEPLPTVLEQPTAEERRAAVATVIPPGRTPSLEERLAALSVFADLAAHSPTSSTVDSAFAEEDLWELLDSASAVD